MNGWSPWFDPGFDRGWGDDACDGDDHNAAFRINWRARLRGLQVPNLLSLLTRVVNGGIRGAIEGVIGGAVSGNRVARAARRWSRPSS